MIADCHDSYRECKEKKLNAIREVVSRHPEGVCAKYVALEAKLTRSTVRNYLPILVSRGVIYQEVKTRLYKSVANSTYGVAAPPKIQNVRLKVVCSDIEIEHGESTEIVDSIKVQITFGKCHNQITGCISAEPPMNLREFKCAIVAFKSLIKKSIDKDVQDTNIVVTSCELNNDYEGIRMDGIECFSLQSFFGFMEKYYNKNGSIRREIRVGPMALPVLQAAIAGGIKSAISMQLQQEIMQEIGAMHESIKFQNRHLSDLSAIYNKGKQ